MFYLRRSKSCHIERSKEWADRRLCRFLRLTLNNCRRADRSWARGRRWAFRRRRALDDRATRARAWRAFARFSLTLAVVNNDRLGLGDTALQDILA